MVIVLDDPRKAKTLPQLIRAAAKAYGNDVAVKLTREDAEETVSFAELDAQSAAIARGLLARAMEDAMASRATSAECLPDCGRRLGRGP